MISYILQIGITCFFGLVVPILAFTIKRRSWTHLDKLAKFLRKLQSPANEVNAFFCITVMISAIVRYTEMPPIIEILFIQELVNMQCFIMFTLLIAATYDSRSNKVPVKTSHIIYNIALMFAQTSATSAVALPHKAYATYHEVAKACHDIRGYKDVSFYFATTSSGSWKWFGIGIAAPSECFSSSVS